ncbi:hypothetical protein D3C81_2066380 [compost metagenome]
MQAQFQPHLVALFFIFAQQIKHRFRHAVRTGADTQPDDVRLADRLLIHSTQHLNFRKSAGIGLEIGQVAFSAVYPMRLMRQLFSDRTMLLRLIGK